MKCYVAFTNNARVRETMCACEQPIWRIVVDYEVEIVRRVKDADGVACRECETWFDQFTNQTVTWGWRTSQWMHERGTGHRMELYRVVKVSAA